MQNSSRIATVENLLKYRLKGLFVQDFLSKLYLITVNFNAGSCFFFRMFS